MTLSTTPPAAPPAPPPILRRCGGCACWWGVADEPVGTCTLHGCPQRRDAVACPDWQRQGLRLERSVH